MDVIENRAVFNGSTLFFKGIPLIDDLAREKRRKLRAE